MTTTYKGVPIPELKRKAKFEPAICTAKGCRNTTKLETYLPDYEGRGPVLLCESCLTQEVTSIITDEQIDILAALQAVAPPPTVAEQRAADRDPFFAPDGSARVEARTEAEIDASLAKNMKAAMDPNPTPAELEMRAARAVVVPPAPGPDPVQAEITAATTEADEVLSEVKTFVIGNDADLTLAADLLADVKGRNKRLAEMKEQATRPINEALKNIRGWFRPAEDKLAQIEQAIKASIATFTNAQEQARRDAVKQLEASATSGEAQVALTALSTAQVAPVVGLSTRKIWQMEILDASAVPRQYCTPDEVMIRAAVTSGVREIPGVRIFEKTVVASRST